MDKEVIIMKKYWLNEVQDIIDFLEELKNII